MVAEPKQDTSRAAHVVSAWLAEAFDKAIADDGALNLPDVIDAVLARLLADADLFAEYCKVYARNSLYTRGVQMLSKRRDVRVIHDVAAASAPVTGAQPARFNWLDRIDHSGERYLRLGDMYKPDLLASAEEDEAMGLPYLMKAGLKRKLALTLPEGKKVREAYSDDQIARWARYLKVDWKMSIPEPKQRHAAVSQEPDKEVAD